MQPVPFSKIMLPTVEVPDILLGYKLHWHHNHACHTSNFNSMFMHMLHYLPVVMHVNPVCFHLYYAEFLGSSGPDGQKHGDILKMDGQFQQVYIVCFDFMTNIIVCYCFTVILQAAWSSQKFCSCSACCEHCRTHLRKTTVQRKNYTDFLLGIILSRLVLLLLESNMTPFK
jgi:hypothetical protein